MYQHIMVATDGSPPAEAAVERAVELAAELGASLTAVSIVDTMAYGLVDVRSGIAQEALRDEAQDAVAAVETQAEAAGVPCDAGVIDGEPAEAIGTHAGEIDADLIVVGTHGRRGVSRFLLGSVAERVARSAPVSVLIVRQEVVTQNDD
ncbi:MAG: universal stress protein [Halobacteriaceae archaeon]